MTTIGRIIERAAPLPPATTRKVTVERGLRIPMDDGVTLIADHWAPRIADQTSPSRIPVVLVRTPHGRTGPLTLAGSSHFGYTQWAIAREARTQEKAMVPHTTSSRLVPAFDPPDRFDLEADFGFIWNTAPQRRNGRPRQPRQERGGYLLASRLDIGLGRFDRARRTRRDTTFTVT